LVHEAQQVLAGVGINFDPTDLTGTLSKIAGTIGLFIYSQASIWAGNIMSFVLQFCILILVIFFLLMDIDRLLIFLMKLSPLPDDQDELLLKKFTEIAGAILVVNGISGLFQGLMGGVFFSIIGLKSPVLWGSVMAVLAFLPIFGIGLILVPTSAILLIGGHTGLAVTTFIFYLILSFTVEYLLKPKFVGNHVKMHTLLVFLAIIGGMGVFGILGIIYGPLIVTIFLTLSDLYINEYRAIVDEK
jgi:predicted PurR-regulated permease PerM